jgi:hypothetical protein
VASTFLRPWYVLGPGHRWPYLLIPIYRVMQRYPGTRQSAERLGLITIRDMVGAIVAAVEAPPVDAARVWDVPALRREGRALERPPARR